jgi:hypothetical protein
MSELRRFLIEQAQKPPAWTQIRPSPSPKQPTRKRRETKAERIERRDDWKRAVASLIDRLEGWLREADEDHALTIDRIPITIAERRFGTYTVEGLRVRMGIAEFRLEPIGLNVLGPLLGDDLDTEIRDGWVKIRGGYADYSLYRRKAEQGDEWFVVDEQSDKPRPLDQSVFEDAVLRLLK